MNKILIFCEKIIAVVGCLIFAVLSYYSFRYTLLKQYNSTMLETRDNLPVHFLAVAVMLVISCVLYRISHKISAKAVHVMAVLLSGLVFFACIAIYMSAEFLPIVDQGHVYMNAVAIADKEVGHIIEPEYYILYSFQIGLTELMALAMKLTGNTTVGLLEIIQSLFSGMATYAGFRITRELFHRTNIEVIYLLLAILFLPQYLYAMFIYGESLGICATMYACLFFLLANRKKMSILRSVWYYAAMILCMDAAYLARGAMMIACIAMLILQIMFCLKQKKYYRLLPVLMLFPVLIMTGKGMTALAERQSQFDYGDGCPKIMWVAMGLQENEGDPQCPGTYNGFNADTYSACDYDAKATAEIGKDEIRKILGEWGRNPGKMLNFFKRKMVYQWNDPSYDAFFSTYYMENQKEWLDRVYFDDAVHSRVVQFMNNYQFLVYLMLLMYFLKNLSGKNEIEALLPVLILIGGFLFSLIWEGRSRYVYPYIVIALPCAAAGIHYTEQWIERILYNCGKKRRRQ